MGMELTGEVGREREKEMPKKKRRKDTLMNFLGSETPPCEELLGEFHKD